MLAADAVVAARRDSQLCTTRGAGQVHQAHMQVAAGVQGYRRVLAVERLGGVRRQYVLLQVRGGQVMALAQLLAVGDQCGVVLQAGQLLLSVQ